METLTHDVTATRVVSLRGKTTTDLLLLDDQLTRIVSGLVIDPPAEDGSGLLEMMRVHEELACVRPARRSAFGVRGGGPSLLLHAGPPNGAASGEARTGDTDSVSGTPWVAEPSPADVAAVRALAPLAADLTIRCGPFNVPAGVTASKPTLEQETSEESQILRDFLDDDPFAGMGSVHPGGWLLLARDDDTVVLGQREDRVGLGTVVELKLSDGAFHARRSGGWGLQLPDESRRVEVCFTARAEGTTVTLDWMNEQGAGGALERVDPRVELLEGPDDVHFLLHTGPADHLPARNSWISGTGRAAVTFFELDAPLGQRRLLNDQRIPPVVVTLLPDGRSSTPTRERPS